MARLTPAEKAKLEAELIAGKRGTMQLAGDYDIQPSTVIRHRKRLEAEGRELDERIEKKGQVTTIDTQAERKDDLHILKKALLDPIIDKVNKGEMLATKEVGILLQALNTRTKILDGYDKSHKLQLNYFDMRDQSTNIDARGTVARELFDDPDLCEECRLRLLAKHAKDVTM